jgi:hypothetical protein
MTKEIIQMVMKSTLAFTQQNALAAILKIT